MSTYGLMSPHFLPVFKAYFLHKIIHFFGRDLLVSYLTGCLANW